MGLLSSALSPTLAVLTSGFQPLYASFVLPGLAPLSLVQAQGVRVGRQLVQLAFERIGIVLDGPCQR